MPQKPASMYREIDDTPYTRKEYMAGVPGLRIGQFELGDQQGDFSHKVHLEADEACQIRHGALEASRVAGNRYMMKTVGIQNYHIKVRVYPHHVLRENKQASGAGADRVSQGMRQAFGKPVDAAARVAAGQEIITIRTDEKNVEAAKTALRKAIKKLPTPGRVKVELDE